MSGPGLTTRVLHALEEKDETTIFIVLTSLSTCWVENVFLLAIAPAAAASLGREPGRRRERRRCCCWCCPRRGLQEEFSSTEESSVSRLTTSSLSYWAIVYFFQFGDFHFQRKTGGAVPTLGEVTAGWKDLDLSIKAYVLEDLSFWAQNGFTVLFFLGFAVSVFEYCRNGNAGGTAGPTTTVKVNRNRWNANVNRAPPAHDDNCFSSQIWRWIWLGGHACLLWVLFCANYYVPVTRGAVFSSQVFAGFVQEANRERAETRAAFPGLSLERGKPHSTTVPIYKNKIWRDRSKQSRNSNSKQTVESGFGESMEDGAGLQHKLPSIVLVVHESMSGFYVNTVEGRDAMPFYSAMRRRAGSSSPPGGAAERRDGGLLPPSLNPIIFNHGRAVSGNTRSAIPSILAGIAPLLDVETPEGKAKYEVLLQKSVLQKRLREIGYETALFSSYATNWKKWGGTPWESLATVWGDTKDTVANSKPGRDENAFDHVMHPDSVFAHAAVADAISRGEGGKKLEIVNEYSMRDSSTVEFFEQWLQARRRASRRNSPSLEEKQYKSENRSQPAVGPPERDPPGDGEPHEKDSRRPPFFAVLQFGNNHYPFLPKQGT